MRIYILRLAFFTRQSTPHVLTAFQSKVLHKQIHQFLFSSHQENIMLLLYSHVLHISPYSQVLWSKTRWAKGSDIEQYLQTRFVILNSSSWNTQLKAHVGISSPWCILYYVKSITGNAVCKQQKWLLHSQLSHKEFKSFYLGGPLLYQAALGLISITQWWMGTPCQGHVYLQCLLSCSTSSSPDTDGWSIWFSSNWSCDFSLLRTLPFDVFAVKLSKIKMVHRKTALK